MQSSVTLSTAGSSTKPSCGPKTYEVVNAATGQPVPNSMFWLDTSNPASPKLFVLIMPGDAYPTSIKIKMTQGPDEANVSNSVLSAPIFIQLTDPCLQTVLQSQLIQAMAATSDQTTPSTQTFLPFKDSVSVQYGNGSGTDLCGPQTYQLFELVNSVLTPKNFVYLTSGQLVINLDPQMSDAMIG